MRNKIAVDIATKIKDSPVNKLAIKIKKLELPIKKTENSFSRLTSKIKLIVFDRMKNKIRNATNSLRAFKIAGQVGIGILGSKIKGAFNGKPVNDFKNKVSQLNNRFNKTSSILGGIKNKVIGLGAGLLAGFGARKLIEASDINSLRNSRLKMVTNDVDGLKSKTFQSAQDSGANYGQQLDQIAKLKMLTNGLFNDSEAVKFTATLDKAFKVSGTSAEEASSAMFQLNQAMTSGKLQGDEFRSVMENAPILAQKIADSMGLSMAQLKKAGSDGKITSEVIKKAVLDSSVDIENQYKKMPITFSKVFQQAKNAGERALDGILNKINELLNSEPGKRFAKSLQDGMNQLVVGATKTFDFILKILNSTNFAPIIEPFSKLGNVISKTFANINTDGFQNLFQTVINTVGAIIASLEPIISFLVPIIGKIINAIVLMSPILMPIIGIVGSIVGAFSFLAGVITPIIGIVQTISSVIALITNPIGWVITAIVGLTIFWNLFKDKIIIGVQTIGVFFKRVWDGLVTGVSYALILIVGFFINRFNNIKNGVKIIIDAIKGFILGIFDTVGKLGEKIGNALSGLNLFKRSGKNLGIGQNYTGTNSWGGGFTTVAERGAELINIPGQQPFLAQREMLLDLPQGTEILNAESTRKELANFGNLKSLKTTKNITNTTNTTSNDNNSNVTFNPTIIIQGSNDENIESKINNALSRFFEEQIIAMGG